ncbi:MAG: glycosyltransferase family 2 protein [Anaerolineae bacterium]|nr:glycosyltransferase family 2 protein [Anaerolineae bacterium]
MTAAASIVFTTATLLLAAYALSALILTILYLWHRSKVCAHAPLTHYPRVTVQLPIYNEAMVVERLIHAVTHFDWPRERLEIQVLDDSTDDTTLIAQTWVEYYRAKGFDIRLLRREKREGFKAGALQMGLQHATGELIAVFDADFVPGRDWLQKTVPYFLSCPRLGMLQTRWSHLNREYSWLTRAQAIALDGHFVVEQTARQRSGLLFSFNGTAGIWRRECIEQSGGWQSDTLCEDMDLSFRAQLAGWECLYLPDVTTPSEIPPQLAALKRQQFRWAKGTIQCLLKLGKRVATSNKPWYVRVMALMHLSAYLVHPLLLFSVLATLPMLLSPPPLPVSPGIVGMFTTSPLLMYAVGQIALHGRNWFKYYATSPLLVLLGIGIALNNTRGVLEALFGTNNVFLRTPKFGLEGDKGKWQNNPYVLDVDMVTLGELALAFYALASTLVAWRNGYLHIIPSLLLYVAWFAYVGGTGLWEAGLKSRRRTKGTVNVLPVQRLASDILPELSTAYPIASVSEYPQPVSQVVRAEPNL